MKVRKKNNKIWLASNEELQKLLDNCVSFKEIINSFGLNENTKNYQILKERIKEDNLSVIKFKENARKYKLEILSFANKKVDLKDVLVENSSYSHAWLKKRLIEEGYLEYKCDGEGENGEGCGIDKWHNKPISLQLEHINGIRNDNRIENLRLLCPNCHSQTDTFAGKKNKGKVFTEKHNECIDCGSSIGVRAKRCIDCARKNSRRIKDRPSKEQLLKDVEEFGYTGTGRKYGVWDNTIRKWLR